MNEAGRHSGTAGRPRVMVVTDRYPLDPRRSPAAWMLPHLQALARHADIEVVSLLRLFPRIKNLLFGGYDRDLLRGRADVPAVEHPFPHVAVFHRRCISVPDRLGWTLTPLLLRLQQRRWLSARMRDFRPDVMLVHYVHAAAPLAIEAGSTFDVPVWIDENETLGSMTLENQTALRFWILARLAQADTVITQCSRQTAELRALLPGIRLEEIPLGPAVDTGTWEAGLREEPDRSESEALPGSSRGDRSEAGRDPDSDEIRLLCVTRLDQVTKNIVPLLQGIADARKNTDVDFRLTVAGDGYQLAALRREAHRLGLGNAVEWRGWVAPHLLHSLRAEAAAAVQPSEHESFGLAALEAASAALPLIAGAHAGVVADLMAHGAAVLPLERATPGAIAAALRELADRLPELRRQALEARGRILELYSWSAHASRYARVLRYAAEMKDGRHRG